MDGITLSVTLCAKIVIETLQTLVADPFDPQSTLITQYRSVLLLTGFCLACWNGGILNEMIEMLE
jgi:hypothetical protein